MKFLLQELNIRYFSTKDGQCEKNDSFLEISIHQSIFYILHASFVKVVTLFAENNQMTYNVTVFCHRFSRKICFVTKVLFYDANCMATVPVQNVKQY